MYHWQNHTVNISIDIYNILFKKSAIRSWYICHNDNTDDSDDNDDSDDDNDVNNDDGDVGGDDNDENL